MTQNHCLQVINHLFWIDESALTSDSHAAALAAAYGAAYATTGFGSSGSGGSANSTSAPNYASYYNNYMAFYPHTATPAAGYAGYGTGAGSVGPQLPTHPSTTGNQAIYHLNNALPPPSISEPGINSLDDIVTNKPGRLIQQFRYNSFTFLQISRYLLASKLKF